MKKQTGITLIALVITIIVLLILAGTAISMSVSGDGIFKKANETVDKWNEKVSLQDNEITSLFNYMEQYTNTGDYEYVYYEPTGGKFVITSKSGDTVTLSPITFPTSYEYMLSGAYKTIGEQKKSVGPNESGAQIDATYEEFDARIKAELDTACEALFAGDNRVLSVVNAREAFNYTDIVSTVNSIITNAKGDIQNIITNFASKIEEYKSIFDLDNETIGEIRSNKEMQVTAQTALYMALKGQIDVGDFLSGVTEYMQLLQSINNGTTSIDSLEPEERLLAQEADLLQSIVAIDISSAYWIYGTGEWLHYPDDQPVDRDWAASCKEEITVYMDTPENGYYLLRYGDDDNATATNTTKHLAPVITVNANILEDNGDGTYTIPTL